MSHDDFKFEPVRGLPEALPEDEHILWQGSPDPWRLAVEALSLKWVAGYFIVLAVWRIGVSSIDYSLTEAMSHGIPFILVGAVACLVIYGLATVQARSAVYTLTNKRVALRIGAALTMTLNLPYTQIANANLDLRRGGTGTVAFELKGDTRFSYLMTWPHVRPWFMSKTQPSLRCIPQAERVAHIFADAADARVSQPQLERIGAASVAAE
ncbi:MAG: PH domain-containing protein [Silicimonas sp.]|nr:PH domain-containing protein [Silicimonas sp.]